MTITESITQTIEAPGATLAYDVRRNDTTTEPPLVLIGSPMGAAGFVSLASHFPDRTIVTYDPRGADRSAKADPDDRVDARRSTPTTSTGSSRRSAADPWTSSPAAAAR